MNGWGWVLAGYLLTGAMWAGYLIWTRPGQSR
jgi:hypothetical protein